MLSCWYNTYLFVGDKISAKSDKQGIVGLSILIVGYTI